MTTVPTENLCTSCGLCCDGSLFAEVELKGRRESFTLESFGLDIEEGEESELLIQPCGALNGTRCSIYEHRPKCCRTFECRLLRDVEEGKRTRLEASEIIQETRDLVTQINRGIGRSVGRKHLPLKERYLEALERSSESKNRAELEEVMRKLENRIELNFLI